MIEHVWRAASRCSRVDALTIATGDPEVAKAAQHFGGEVHMDRSPYPNGTERSAAAKGAADIVVVIQADQPGLNPMHLSAAIEALIDSGADMATLGAPLTLPCDSPHVVKCLSGPHGRALNFTRSSMTHPSTSATHRHLGVYVYTREAIERYVELGAHRRETREDLEQLRALEAGFDIRIVEVHDACPAVDTPSGDEPAERWISRSIR